jgi:hypothetical protein
MFPHERHLTVHQIALRRNLSHDTIRRIFLSEPGVIVIATPKAHKRVYRSLRIPESIEQRVFSRFTNGGRP